MKPITQLTKEDIKDIKLLCFDVDGVTVERGTEIEVTETTLKVKTSALSPQLLEKLLKLKKRFFVCISSGRGLLYLTRMYSELLWDNTALTGENGIFTLIDGQVIQHEIFSKETLKQLRDMTVDLTKLSKTNKDFRAFEPKQFLITVHAWKEIPEVYEIVKKHDPKDEFYCLWNGEAFDIAPKRLNKGEGLKHLAKYLKLDMVQTMSIGNGPNDREMVEAAGIGVTTDPEELPADFHTTGSLHLGGEELVDKLLELINE